MPSLCRAYAVKMRGDAAFTSLTAARLWGIPLPADAENLLVHVSAPHGGSRPGGRGVRGHQHDPALVGVVELDGLRVLSPRDTWVSLARVLDLPDLVAAGDYLVTPPFGRSSALLDPEQLRGHLPMKTPGRRTAMRAAELIRVGALSRPESLSRVLFVTAGIPEAVANLRVGPTFMPDLAWPDWRVAFDYLGDGHRSPTRFARDVARIDFARELGWDLILATKSDLFGSPFDLVGRVRSRLSAKGAPLGRFDPRHMVVPRP